MFLLAPIVKKWVKHTMYYQSNTLSHLSLLLLNLLNKMLVVANTTHAHAPTKNATHTNAAEPEGNGELALTLSINNSTNTPIGRPGSHFVRHFAPYFLYTGI
jgi:hypothetical protein